jgi:hypothetical protein
VVVLPNKGYSQGVSQTFIQQMDLHVTSSCKNGTAIFKVSNVGEEKIEGVNFRLFKVTEGLVVSKRRLSLKKGQTATFKVKNAQHIPDQIGLFIDSKAIPRAQKTDVSIQCSE